MPTHMRKLIILAVAVGTTLASGCGSSGGGSSSGKDPRIEVAGLDPTPAGENGFQLILPKVTDLAPGGSFEYCTWTDKILDQDLNVKGTQAFQTQGGHHVVIFYTTKPKPAGTTRLCTDDDMTSVRFGIGGESKTYNELPADLAVTIPKGAQIVAQHHYINPTSAPLTAQSAINVTFVPPGQAIRQSSSVVVVDSNLRVPAGKAAVDLHCTINRDYTVWMMLPHMHKYGSYISVDHTDGAGQTTRLFDLKWDPEYEFHAPRIIKPVEQAMTLKAGDKMQVHCEWNNDSGGELSFGQEMCLAFGQTLDNNGIGNVACDAGQWTTF